MTQRRQGRGSQEFAKRVRRTHGDQCHLCGGWINPDLEWSGPMGASFTVDHLIPVSQGGRDRDVNNALPSHARCNTLRGTLTVNQARAKLAAPAPSDCASSDLTDWDDYVKKGKPLPDGWSVCATHGPGLYVGPSGSCTAFALDPL